MNWVLGVDPGATTAFVLLAEEGPRRDVKLIHLDEVSFSEKGMDRFLAVGQAVLDQIERIDELAADAVMKTPGSEVVAHVVIEDVSTSHGYVSKSKKTGQRERRSSHSIASVQRDYAALVMAFMENTGISAFVDDHVILAPVAKWYPRMDGHLLAKKLAIQYLRQSCRGDNLQSEHLVMAYGIASWGLNHLRTLEQIRRARPT